MHLRAAAFLALIFATGVALAQVTYGETELEFGYITNAKGERVDVTGTVIQYRIQPIKAREFGSPGADRSRGRRPNPRSGRGGGLEEPASADIVVYQNDTGDNAYTPNNSSSLDDLVLIPGSENKAWRIVSFAVNLGDFGGGRTDKFLVRWRSWETPDPGQGPGQPAFIDELFDFGFYLDPLVDFPSTIGAFEVTVDLSLSPIAIVPNRVCYFAQQYREPTFPEEGEGQFVTNVAIIFASNGPQIGTSEDLFYYDNPPDGIYDETEIDNYGPDFPGANMYLEIKVSTSATDVLRPATFQWFRGNPISGNIGSLWFDDDNYLVGEAGITLNQSEPPAQLIVETFISSTTVSGIRFDVTSKVGTVGLKMDVDLWNYATNRWIKVHSGIIGTSESTVLTFAPGNLADYIHPANLTMRSKVSYFQVGPAIGFPWTVFLEKLQWVVNT